MKNLNIAFPLDTPLKKLQKAQIYTGSSCKAVLKMIETISCNNYFTKISYQISCKNKSKFEKCLFLVDYYDTFQNS